MGATNIYVIQKGSSMRDAFNLATEEANDEYGHQQGQSGQINSCELSGDKTAKYKELGEEDFEEWAEDNTDKREVVGFEIEKGKYGFIGWAPEQGKILILS